MRAASTPRTVAGIASVSGPLKCQSARQRERAGLEEAACELLDEEGVAVRAGNDEVADVLRDVLARQQRREQRTRLGCVNSGRTNTCASGTLNGAPAGSSGRRAPAGRRASRAARAGRSTRRPPSAGPPRSGPTVPWPRDGPAPSAPRRATARKCLPVGPRRLVHDPVQLLQRCQQDRVIDELPDTHPELVPDHVERVPVGDGQLRREQIDHKRIWGVLRQRGGPSGQASELAVDPFRNSSTRRLLPTPGSAMTSTVDTFPP